MHTNDVRWRQFPFWRRLIRITLLLVENLSKRTFPSLLHSQTVLSPQSTKEKRDSYISSRRDSNPLPHPRSKIHWRLRPLGHRRPTTVRFYATLPLTSKHGAFIICHFVAASFATLQIRTSQNVSDKKETKAAKNEGRFRLEVDKWSYGKTFRARDHPRLNSNPGPQRSRKTAYQCTKKGVFKNIFDNLFLNAHHL